MTVIDTRQIDVFSRGDVLRLPATRPLTSRAPAARAIAASGRAPRPRL